MDCGDWYCLLEEKVKKGESLAEHKKDFINASREAIRDNRLGVAFDIVCLLGDEKISRELAEEMFLKNPLNSYTLDLFIKFGYKERVEALAYLYENEEGSSYNAFRAFEFLNDRAGMLRAICKEWNKGGFIEFIVDDYAKDKKDVFLKAFHNWALKKGYEGGNPVQFWYSINMMHQAYKEYDTGVGVAKGGLFLTFLAEKYGLDTLIVDAHRKGVGASFHWAGDKKSLKGKKVAVFDKDVVSGRTAKRVLRELEGDSPAYIDLILAHWPLEIGGHSILLTVPEGYRKVLHPKLYGFEQFDNAVDGLEKKLTQEK